MSQNEIEWIMENKCSIEDCYHHTERGVIYCIHHLHGSCSKFDDEDIERIKKYKEVMSQK